MHEMGHTLNLFHGGAPIDPDAPDPQNPVDINCKPNYRSVMNYLYQFNQSDGGFADRPLDYARTTYAQINEDSLTDGQTSRTGPEITMTLGGWDPTVDNGDGTFGAPVTPRQVDSKGPIIWDNDSTPETGYDLNLRYFESIPGCQEQDLKLLKGQVDWQALSYSFRTGGTTFQDGRIEVNNLDNQLVSTSGVFSPDTVIPDISALPNVTILENATGDNYFPTISILDPHSTTWNVTINYDDGTFDNYPIIDTDGLTPEGNEINDHTYPDGPTFYNNTVTILNNDWDGINKTSVTVTVENVAPFNIINSSNIIGSVVLGERSPSIPANFTDPGDEDIWNIAVDYHDAITFRVSHDDDDAEEVAGKVL